MAKPKSPAWIRLVLRAPGELVPKETRQTGRNPATQRVYFLSEAFATIARHMADPIPADVTQLLEQWSGGDREALDKMIPLAYDELRRMAHGHMAQERAGHTIQATALVNEFI
jgi:hypothetical protein